MQVRLSAIALQLIAVLAAASVSAQFYYSDGRRIPLNVDESKILVKIDSTLTTFGPGMLSNVLSTNRIAEQPRADSDASFPILVQGRVSSTKKSALAFTHDLRQIFL